MCDSFPAHKGVANTKEGAALERWGRDKMYESVALGYLQTELLQPSVRITCASIPSAEIDFGAENAGTGGKTTPRGGEKYSAFFGALPVLPTL